MNVARADDNTWHIAEGKGGIYIRMGERAEGIVMTRDEAWEFLAGLTGVLGGKDD